MATTRVMFFSTPEEIATALNELGRKLSLQFICVSARNGEGGVYVEDVNSRLASMVKPCNLRIFRSTVAIHVGDFITWRSLFEAAWFRMPQQEGDVLFLGEIGAKSDFYNSELGLVEETEGGVDLVKMIRKHLRIWDRCVVSARGASPASEEKIYKAIKCTAGARKFFESGGDLRQDGVRNVIFTARKASKN